jgi:hypothetical protein
VPARHSVDWSGIVSNPSRSQISEQSPR